MTRPGACSLCHWGMSSGFPFRWVSVFTSVASHRRHRFTTFSMAVIQWSWVVTSTYTNPGSGSGGRKSILGGGKGVVLRETSCQS